MKKFFLTAALAISSLAVNAQWYAGGQIAFHSDKYEGSDATTVFGFCPEIGHTINDKWGIGLSLGYINRKDYSTTFSIAPYARYTFARVNQFDFIIDGSVFYESQKRDAWKDATSTFGVGLKPGVIFNINKRFAIIAQTNDLLSIKSTGKNESAGSVARTQIGFDVNTLGLSLGAYIKF